MTPLLSPTDCFYCRSDTNIQSYKFPCGCSIYSHPDCYKNFELTHRIVASYRWHLACPKCKNIFSLPDLLQLQIQALDDDMQPLTRREMREEKCKICAILVIQSILFSGLVSACIYGYYTIIMSTV